MKLIVGVIAFLFILLGYIIKKEKDFKIIAGYDKDKDNPDFICNLFGFNFILIGGILGILTIVSIVLQNVLNNKWYAISCIIVIIIMFSVIYFRRSINRVK